MAQGHPTAQGRASPPGTPWGHLGAPPSAFPTPGACWGSSSCVQGRGCVSAGCELGMGTRRCVLQEDDDCLEHLVLLRTVSLGAGARDELHVVAVESKNTYGGCKPVPIASLRGSVLPMVRISLKGLEFVPPVTFVLECGAGPVYLSGQHVTRESRMGSGAGVAPGALSESRGGFRGSSPPVQQRLLFLVEDDRRYGAREEELAEEDAGDEDGARAAQDGDAVAWGCAPCVALAGQRHQQVAVAELRSPLRAARGGDLVRTEGKVAPAGAASALLQPPPFLECPRVRSAGLGAC
uniref:Nucleoplasmin core domain-containing protein n=1 Tax=Anser brachyrhynchus TaxID=132585 RepID=A0A8B9HYC0_9AVES